MYYSLNYYLKNNNKFTNSIIVMESLASVVFAEAIDVIGNCGLKALQKPNFLSCCQFWSMLLPSKDPE